MINSQFRKLESESVTLDTTDSFYQKAYQMISPSATDLRTRHISRLSKFWEPGFRVGRSIGLTVFRIKCA
ncbi:MAG: hypothetical protein CBE00_04150 [Planctomycetaceae bacterium TMED240]|nr:hypothetical protein [Rhodopirellula sp.]OUX07694.1 MAG: hypothetical protein CBE00_04150 [Planctomycetaceae bacterium TMED240]